MKHTCGIDGDPGAVTPLSGRCEACQVKQQNNSTLKRFVVYGEVTHLISVDVQAKSKSAAMALAKRGVFARENHVKTTKRKFTEARDLE